MRPNPFMEQSGQPVRTAVQLIAKEVEEAGCSKWDVLKIIKALGEEQDMNLDGLRRKTLQLLETVNPRAAQVYASFNKLHVYTSAERMEAFDRGNIIKSLLRETDITRGVAEKIGSEVEDKVKDLDINYLNTPLIREMADVKLLEYGHEAIHNQYTRVGLPVYEVRKKIENEPFANREVLLEFNWLQVIPARERQFHFSCDYSVSHVEDFSTRPLACSVEPVFSGDSMGSAVADLVEHFSRLQPLHSLPLNLNALNVLVSRQLPRGKKNLKAAATLLCRVLNALYPVSSQAFARPSVGLDLFVREHLEGFSKQSNQAFDFANEFIRVYCEGIEGMRFDLVTCVESKYQLKLLDNRLFSDCKMNLLNCRASAFRPFNGLRSHASSFLAFDASLNLLLQALSFKDSRKQFDARLNELCSSLASLAQLKAETLKSRVYLQHLEPGISSAGNSLDLFGLFDAPRAFREGLSEKEYAEEAQSILAELCGALDESWSFSAQRNDASTNRFAAHLSEKLGFVAEPRKVQQEFQRFNATSKKRLVFRNMASTRSELEEFLGENTRLITFMKQPVSAPTPAEAPKTGN